MKTKNQKPRAEPKAGRGAYPYPEIDVDKHAPIFGPVSLSLILHVILLSAILFMPQPSFEKSYAPTVINVRMVSLEEIQPSSSAPDQAIFDAPAAEPEADPAEYESDQDISESSPEPQSEVQIEEKITSPQPEKKPEPEVSLAPRQKPDKTEKKPEKKEIKIKKSLKKKTFKPSEIIRSAVKKLEKESEKTQPKSVLDAIAKLREDVDKKPRKAKPSEKSENKGGGSGTSSRLGKNSEGSIGGSLGSMFNVYQAIVAEHIQRNWAFSEQLAGNRKNLETLVGIKILPSGQIEDIWFDKKSGNKYLDDSAFRAIKKSSPLPPLPRDFRGRFLKVGLRFTPRGLT